MYGTPIEYTSFLNSAKKSNLTSKEIQIAFGVYCLLNNGRNEDWYSQLTNKLISRFLAEPEATLKMYIPRIIKKGFLLDAETNPYRRALKSFFPTTSSCVAKLIYKNESAKLAKFAWRLPAIETLIEIKRRPWDNVQRTCL